MMPDIPSRAECLALLSKYKVPKNIIRHCIKVNEIAMFLAQKIKARGEKVNLRLVDASSLLHDIDKAMDVEREGRHGKMSREILEKEGYPEVAKIAEKHVQYMILEKGGLSTLEEKIVFYADKRVSNDRIVSVKERFNHYRKNYPQYLESISRAEPLVNELEKELMEKAGIRAESIGKA